MKMKRLISGIIALVLIMGMPVSAFAADWYLEEGDITVSADSSGQTVSQGGGAAVADNAPVISQRDGSTATDSTITISTSDGATANVTIEDVNISSNGDAIDVGDSSANIKLEGDNKLSSESGSGIHVSGGDVTITGSGSLEAGSKNDNNNNAAIGSHEGEDMSGDITIGGSTKITAESGRNGAGIGSGDGGEMSGAIAIGDSSQVKAKSVNDGAGIGSGDDGKMSGSISIGGSSQVTAISGNDGAGIGSGEESNMSGDITIGDDAQVTAWSEDRGAGIGSGREGKVSGNITIGDNAQVSAGSDRDGAGIGGGKKGSITSTGRIIIRGSAKVTAIGEDEGTGIGPGEDKKMKGLIIIQDNAQVTAIAGDCAAAIGSDDRYEMTGTIIIIGNVRITTGVLDDDEDVYFDYNTNEIKYTLNEDYIGYLGDSQSSNHASDSGHYIIGPDVTINDLSGSDIEALKDYINMRLSGENNDGEPENLTKLDIRSENGEFTATSEGEGTVEKILYGGNETAPTAPGTYPVTCVVRLGDETIEFQIGTLVVPEPEKKSGSAEALQSPLYRVTDKDGKDVTYKAEQEDGTLTITAKYDFAILTGSLGGMKTLKAQGVEKIVFVTNGAESAFMLSDLLESGKGGDSFKLAHDGGSLSFTVGTAETDISEILIDT